MADRPRFLELHGLKAKDANYDKLAERITDAEYEGMLDVIKEEAGMLRRLHQIK
jgi:hypothetical protein